MTVQDIVNEINRQVRFWSKVDVKPKEVWLGKEEVKALKEECHVKQVSFKEEICGLNLKRSCFSTCIEVN